MCPQLWARMTHRSSFDFVIVGAGSAGCVLANRLSADPDTRVLVLEAGPSDSSILIRMPAGVGSLLTDVRFNWSYLTEPEPALHMRPLAWPRGRVLGGSSSINGMAYVRGHALDYERWAGSGLGGWSYAEVLPYFKRSETFLGDISAYRGTSGPLHVMRGPATAPLYSAYLQAGREAGFPLTDDQNGFQQEGFGRMDMTIHRGRRCSAADAYLSSPRTRGNLKVSLQSLAKRILFEGRRAVGVQYLERGRVVQALAEREVLLCGGAINSPQLLMLSGIGEADGLKRMGIAPIADLSGVGRNLQDHPEVYLQYACKRPVSLRDSFRPHRKLLAGVEWLMFKSGVGASNHSEAGAFLRVGSHADHPDIQHHFVPMAFAHDTKAPLDCHSFQLHISPMRPKSRGRLTLRSSDPRDHPIIHTGYYGEEQDLRLTREAVKVSREIVAQRAFDQLRGAEIAPGADIRSDHAIDTYIRATTETAYHPCGTARMGSGNLAVVDHVGRVHGVDGLRVVDASILPTIVSGNLNASIIMMAEKIADVVLGRAPLPSEDLPFHRPFSGPKSN